MYALGNKAVLDPYQLASRKLEASWSGSTLLFQKGTYLSSVGQGLNFKVGCIKYDNIIYIHARNNFSIVALNNQWYILIIMLERQCSLTLNKHTEFRASAHKTSKSHSLSLLHPSLYHTKWAILRTFALSPNLGSHIFCLKRKICCPTVGAYIFPLRNFKDPTQKQIFLLALYYPKAVLYISWKAQ